MTIVACDQTRCVHNRKAKTPREKEISPTICDQDYIIAKTVPYVVPPRPRCDDFEVEESEDGEPD